MRVDEILRASGNVELILPNGTSYSTREISSPETSIILQFQPLNSENIGEYSCVSTVQSPEYPGSIRQQFQSVNFDMSKILNCLFPICNDDLLFIN